MDIIAAYAETGSYRAAADICGTTHKTVARVVTAHEAAIVGQVPAPRVERGHNFDGVADLVAEKVKKTKGRISAKKLLPVARAAGYEGSGRNFRRLVAEAKSAWRGQQGHRGRRPAVWVPGDTLVIDWGVLDGLHVFCAVLAWSRVRFVRFAGDETEATTLGLLAECLEVIGGVPRTVLADRMGCLKGGVVADVVVPNPVYVRFAAHYGFGPDFCQAADPASKGIVENLVGYAKDDLMTPMQMFTAEGATLADADLAAVNQEAARWCEQVNAVVHSEICAVPNQRLVRERGLLGALPSLRPVLGPAPITRRVDKLSCIRFASARYSVPNQLVGATVTVLVDTHQGQLSVVNPVTGEVHAHHQLVAPGETSISDAHYDRPRPDKPKRAPRAKTPTEKAFLGLGPVAEQFLTGAAAAGVTKLPAEIKAIMDLHAAHGQALLPALSRAVAFRRWRADDVRSILATNGRAPDPTPAGQALVLTLPTVPTRPLSAYAIDTTGGEGA